MVDLRYRRAKSRPLFFFFVVLFSFLVEPTFQQRNPSSPLSSSLEFSALYELRSSLGIRSRDWPRKSDPCLAWAGVRCNNNGRVVEINVSRFRRTRIGRQNPRFAVDSLVNFTVLESFNASNFSLPGPIPVLFGHSLASLRVLDLRSCSVLGPIPLGLGDMKNLTALYLSRNNLSGSVPSSLGQLSSLSALDLAHNSLSGSIPEELGDLKSLSVLDFSSNSLLGSVPAPIGAIAGLVSLDLGDNSLGGSLPESFFAGQNELQVLILRGNNFSGELPGAIWTAPSLRFVDISGNNFTGQLPNTTLISNAAVNISGNSFFGGLSSALARFSPLDLSGNYFQGTVPSFTARVAKNCLRNSTDQRTQLECESFYAEKGLTFDDFGVPSPVQPRAAPEKKKSNRRVVILAAVLGSIGLIVLLALALALILFFARKRANPNQRGVGVGVGPVPPSNSPPKPGVSMNYSSVGDAFTHQQLLQATAEFTDANLMKNGHSGDLFRGVLESGIPVVVKRVDLGAIKREFHITELDFFGKVSHARFVPFLGHCLESEDEKFMVYRFMPNADLASSLHKKSVTEDDGLQSLDWITRLKIALGAAEGLSHLHHECNPPLVHRDVQSSSILLDDKFEVRLGSLSEICAQEGDAHQSKITRLLRLPQSSEPGTSGTPTATCAYDVYCFGKVLLELVTGKMGISASSDAATKEWLDQTLPYISIYDKELVTKILDPSLIVDEDLLEEVWAMAVVARSCLNPKPSRRPPMRYILKALENPLKVVREETSGSARLRTTSSRGSWNAALFGSWRSSSDVTAIPAKAEGVSGMKNSGTTGSQGSSSHRRNSREIFPEPAVDQD